MMEHYAGTMATFVNLIGTLHAQFKHPSHTLAAVLTTILDNQLSTTVRCSSTSPSPISFSLQENTRKPCRINTAPFISELASALALKGEQALGFRIPCGYALPQKQGIVQVEIQFGPVWSSSVPNVGMTVTSSCLGLGFVCGSAYPSAAVTEMWGDGKNLTSNSMNPMASMAAMMGMANPMMDSMMNLMGKPTGGPERGSAGSDGPMANVRGTLPMLLKSTIKRKGVHIFSTLRLQWGVHTGSKQDQVVVHMPRKLWEELASNDESTVFMYCNHDCNLHKLQSQPIRINDLTVRVHDVV